MAKAVEFVNINKRFPGVHVLKDISFSVEEGEVHALLGENGAGKSTLLNILHGVYPEYEGEVRLHGEKVSFKDTNDAIVNGKISKVHQETLVVKDLTVGQNVTMGYEPKKGIFIDFKKMNKEVAKAAKKFGDAFDEAQFRSTNGRVLEHQAKRDALHTRFAKALNDGNLDELRQIIIDEEIVCPISGTKNWTEVRQFNLMFSTDMGSTSEGAMKIYLRPETAQGIFVNYLNVQKTGRMKIPFGIAQIGKAFRNEIVARQFIFRMREFEQMEMQFFVKPGTELEWFPKWKEMRLKWHKALGFGDDHYRFHDHDKLAHYANAATDIEFLMPFGFKEVEGIHSRTNFDLSQHEKFSGKSIKYFDPELNESYTPYVIETSIGVDRMFLSIMSAAYCEEQLENGESRVVLKLPAALAPVKLAVMPLIKKDGLPEKAREIIDSLKFHFHCQYDEKDSIGKRYRRQDAIGTPYCVTVDHQTLEDNCVTLRNRDTMQQERVAISELNNIIADRVSITSLLKTLQ